MRPDEPALEKAEAEPGFPLVDAYLRELHAGRRPDRVAFLAEHPELESMLDCLEALEELAPPSAGPDGPAGAPTKSEPPVTGFANYELLEEIGRGGMGVIWKARQKDLDRMVAIKMILTSHLASEVQVERFAVEARAMARLHHPHVVGIHETGQVHGQHYFVMEYIAGPSLSEALRQRRFSAEESARLLSTVAQAVAHLHGQGIVHRDLKPSNILLDEQDRPYVTDFGLVKMLEPGSHVTRTGAIVGTPAYMAPEQAAGHPEQVGVGSDVYSLGAILYELLTGVPPFQGETPLDTLVQVLEGEPERPRRLNPKVPPKLELICLKCLEKTPEERYPTAEALAADLQRYLEGEEVEARAAGIWPKLRRWWRSQPAMVARLAALAVFTVIVQTNYLLNHQVSLAMHLLVTGLLVSWVAASAVFQWGLKRERWAPWVPYAWASVDAVLLTALLMLTQSQMGPLLVGYPFLVAAAGLWFRVPVVWYSTGILAAAYLVLVYSSYQEPEPYRMPHHHIIFVVALAVLGFVMAYQVQRIRALSRYYEHRRLP